MIGNRAFVVFQTTKCLGWDNSPKYSNNLIIPSTIQPKGPQKGMRGAMVSQVRDPLEQSHHCAMVFYEWFPPRLFSTWRLKQMIATYLACLRVLVPQESMMSISILGASLILRHLQISTTMTQGSHNLTLWNDKMSQGFPSLWNWRVMQHEGWHLDMVTEFWDAPANQWYHQICCMIRTLLAPHEMASKKW